MSKKKRFESPLNELVLRCPVETSFVTTVLAVLVALYVYFHYLQ